jgi:hypothetical protein
MVMNEEVVYATSKEHALKLLKRSRGVWIGVRFGTCEKFVQIKKVDAAVLIESSWNDDDIHNSTAAALFSDGYLELS